MLLLRLGPSPLQVVDFHLRQRRFSWLMGFRGGFGWIWGFRGLGLERGVGVEGAWGFRV